MSNSVMLYTLKIGAVLARVIPRKVGHNIFGSLGFLYGLLPVKSNKILIQIHKKISPELNTRQLKLRAAGVMASYSRYWWDVFWLSSKRSSKEIENLVTVEGYEKVADLLKNAKTKKQGVIFVVPHIGSWEVAGAWVANRGFSPLVIAERLKPPELFELFTKTREAVGMEVIAHDDQPTKKLLVGLEQGRIICLVSDRDISRRGIKAEFFGSLKSFPAGPVVLSQKTGAPIIPVSSHVTYDGGVTLSFGNCIVTSKKDGLEKTVQKIAKEFEKMILKDPRQWHVLHYEWEK